MRIPSRFSKWDILETGDRKGWRRLEKYLLNHCPEGSSPINGKVGQLLKEDEDLRCNGRREDGGVCTSLETEVYQLHSCSVWFGNGMFRAISNF